MIANMRQTTKGTLAMVCAALLWSIAGLFIKRVPWNPFAIASMRSAIAAVIVYAYMRVSGYRPVLTRRALGVAIAISGTCFSFTIANKLTTAANAIVLQYCAPIYVLLYVALVRKAKLRAFDVAVVPMTVLGVALCFIDRLGSGSLAGDVIAIVSGFFFAAMILSSQGARRVERISGILFGQTLTALIGLPALIATRPAFTADAVIGVAVLGVFQLGLAYVFYGIAAEHASPITLSVLAGLEPLFSPVWVFLFAGELPGRLALLGGAIVILAVTIWCALDARAAHIAITRAAERAEKPA